MKSMAKWMLGAAVVAGGFGLATTAAQAAEFGVYLRGPEAYVPPCPGPGYQWVAGYYDGGYWVPGSWNFVGYGYGYGYGYARYYGDRDDHRAYYRDRDDYRRGDWDHDRRDGDRERHERDYRGWGDRDRGDHFRR